jgi:predicted HTH domain antitoxin
LTRGGSRSCVGVTQRPFRHDAPRGKAGCTPLPVHASTGTPKPFMRSHTIAYSMAETVSGRVPDDLARELKALGEATGRSRSEVLRDVVRRGLIAERLERALDAYRRREVTAAKASEMAGIPLTSFFDEVRRNGLLRDYDVEDLERDLEWAERA